MFSICWRKLEQPEKTLSLWKTCTWDFNQTFSSFEEIVLIPTPLHIPAGNQNIPPFYYYVLYFNFSLQEREWNIPGPLASLPPISRLICSSGSDKCFIYYSFHSFLFSIYEKGLVENSRQSRSVPFAVNVTLKNNGGWLYAVIKGMGLHDVITDICFFLLCFSLYVGIYIFHIKIELLLSGWTAFCTSFKTLHGGHVHYDNNSEVIHVHYNVSSTVYSWWPFDGLVSFPWCILILLRNLPAGWHYIKWIKSNQIKSISIYIALFIRL